MKTKPRDPVSTSHGRKVPSAAATITSSGATSRAPRLTQATASTTSATAPVHHVSGLPIARISRYEPPSMRK